MTAKTKVALGSVLVVVVTMLVSGWLIVRRGFSARAEPSAIEAFVARRVRSLATSAEARQALNPVAASQEILSEAMAHFAGHCAFCHANDGSGDTPIGKGLYPKPPDLRHPATQNLTDGELFSIIHNGIRLTGMPAFGEETTGQPDLDSWKLVHFIRRLPDITPEELEAMAKMNPKTPAELEEEKEIEKFLQGDDSQPAEVKHKHH